MSAASNARRAGAIVAALPHLNNNNDIHRLLNELRSFYPTHEFHWDANLQPQGWGSFGLRIYLHDGPVGTVTLRPPASVEHVAYYMARVVDGKHIVLKGALSSQGEPIPALPKTWYDRILDD